MCVCTQLCLTLCGPMNCSPSGSSVHGIFPGKNTAVGCHFLLQGIFPTQGSNPHLLCLLHWQVDSLSLCHLGSPCSYIIYLYILVHHGRELRLIEHDFLQLDMCNQQAVFYSKYKFVALFNKRISIKKIVLNPQTIVLVLCTCMGFISLFLPTTSGGRERAAYILDLGMTVS